MSLKKEVKYKIEIPCPDCGTVLKNTLTGALFCNDCVREWSEEEIRIHYST
ncbi:hypothetical protein LCGC14_1756330 [marine sediment metagenome]|uniref:Uncharacterized protein n=1 Tax=marine sediment metagenome TaxID=412755 RepID=A0A0F9HPP0_9ZZZZ